MIIEFIFENSKRIKREFNLYVQNLNEMQIRKILNAEKKKNERLVSYEKRLCNGV
jgi:hypothetical protein